jgi:WhiB family redox-sensing transcriptional regulator
MDPDVMFPIDAAGFVVARAICDRCPVTAECLEYALANNEVHGCWGGTSERERRKLLRERKGRAA